MLEGLQLGTEGYKCQGRSKSVMEDAASSCQGTAVELWLSDGDLEGVCGNLGRGYHMVRAEWSVCLLSFLYNLETKLLPVEGWADLRKMT